MQMPSIPRSGGATLRTIVVTIVERLQRLQSLGLFAFERRHEFLADHLHDEIGHAFAYLEHNIANVAIGDDDVANAAIDIATFHVADERILERALFEEIMRVLGEIMSFELFRADVHEANRRLRPFQNVSRIDAPHDAILKRCNGFGETFAPTSSSTHGPFRVGIKAAMPGRRTFFRKRRRRRPQPPWRRYSRH